MHDTVITVPPHPFVLDDPSEVPLEECWMALPQLFFTCFLRPVGGRPPKPAMDTYSNSTPTIPHELRHLQSSKFPHGCADAADESGRKGSNVYEVNQWMWEFGLGKPRLGGLSVTETEERRIAVRTEAGRRAQSTREVR